MEQQPVMSSMGRLASLDVTSPTYVIEVVDLILGEGALANASDLIAADERRSFLRAEAAWLNRAKADRNLPEDIDAELMLIASIALRSIPLLLPQLVRLLTGFQSANPVFQRRWSRFLRTLGDTITRSSTLPRVRTPQSARLRTRR